MGKYKQKPLAENIPLRLGSLRLNLKEWNQVGSKQSNEKLLNLI